MDRERIQEDIQFIKEQVDQALRTGTSEACNAIVQTAELDYVRGLAECDNELEILELLTRIHKHEQQEGITNTILCNAGGLEALLEKYYRVLFYLQRIWFEVEPEYQKELIIYVNQKKITPYAVYYILEHSRIVHKERVWKQVMALWENGYE